MNRLNDGVQLPDIEMLDTEADELMDILLRYGCEPSENTVSCILELLAWNEEKLEVGSTDRENERLRRIVAFFANNKEPVKFWALVYATDTTKDLTDQQMVEKARELGVLKQTLDKEILEWLNILKLPFPKWMRDENTRPNFQGVMGRSHKNRKK